MRKKIKTLKIIFLFLLSLLIPQLPCSSCYALNQDAILGKWQDISGKVEIEVYKNADKYHGRILWLREPNYRENDHKGMAGKPRIDRENPDLAMRNRPLLNMDLFWDCIFLPKISGGKKVCCTILSKARPTDAAFPWISLTDLR